jgi:hypothetical protein
MIRWGSSPNQITKPQPGEILQMMRILRERRYVHEPSFWIDLPVSTCAEYVSRFAAMYSWYNKEWIMLGLLRDPLSSAIPTLPTPASTSLDVVTTPLPAAQSITPGAGLVGNPVTPASNNKKTKKKGEGNEPDPAARHNVRLLAAHVTVEILRAQGFTCAIFGSMACKIYGNKREPNVRLSISI